jgi:membrane-bound ClpP family serine protease
LILTGTYLSWPDQEVEAGQSVRVTSIDGLTLKVEPVQRATADVPSVATGRSA